MAKGRSLYKMADLAKCCQEDYKQWELPAHGQHRPVHETVKHNLPFTGSSAYAENFHAHPYEPPYRRAKDNAAYKGKDMLVCWQNVKTLSIK